MKLLINAGYMVEEVAEEWRLDEAEKFLLFGYLVDLLHRRQAKKVVK